MSILKWIKENVFDWSGPVQYRGHRPPEHPPGWRNIKPAKKRANKARTRQGGTSRKSSKSKSRK